MRSELLILVLLLHRVSGEDFYELLGVGRDADERTIRKAFKKLALQKHPDKHPVCFFSLSFLFIHCRRTKMLMPFSFVLIEHTKCWKTSNCERNMTKSARREWTTIRLAIIISHGNSTMTTLVSLSNVCRWRWNVSGIYDEDVEIVTLSRTDFERVVMESGHIWFVNFYSTFCSHCHDLAPTVCLSTIFFFDSLQWRKFAREMDGVLRIGAVNCAEDPMLCQSQRVMGYPSLVLYPSVCSLFWLYNHVYDHLRVNSFMAIVIWIVWQNSQCVISTWKCIS